MHPCSVNHDHQHLINAECTYFSTEDFNSKINSQSRKNHNINLNTPPFSLLHINARSLNKNFDSVELLLSSLQNFQFTIIGISETWLHSNSPPLFNIDNYHMYRSDRARGKGGGVALYIHTNTKIKLRPDLHIHNTEDLFIEILNDKTKNKIVGVIYRPPNNNIDLFLEHFDECLNKISQENKEVYIMGDLNINLLNTNNNNSLKLMSSLAAYSFHSHINDPTRISNTSKSLIDNIFSNVINKPFINGVLYYDISDHLPIFIVTSQSEPTQNTNKSKYKMYRKETKRNVDLLNYDLAQEEWSDVLNETDVEMAYQNFISKLLFLYEKKSPLQKLILLIRQNNHG